MEKIYFYRESKYEIVGKILEDCKGTLLDCGSRDERLKGFLNLGNICYYSADIVGNTDYLIDLEKKIDVPDGKFDYVVALDILEHIDKIHFSFFELSRITSKFFIIALPNMAELVRRLKFVFYGNLGTLKYKLLTDPSGDRHRWLTVYEDINDFVKINSEKAGFVVQNVFEEITPGSGSKNSLFAYLVSKIGLNISGLLTTRCIYVLKRAG